MRIAIVEDNALLRENLVKTLAAMPSHAVVGTYPSAEAALAGLCPREVDCLIVDIELPGLSGIELIRRLRAERWDLPVLVWTIHEDRDVVFGALKAGANGYLLKGCSPEELELSLRQIAEGGAPVSPTIARRLIKEFVEGTTTPPAAELTQREREVLRAVAAGQSYKEIATEFGVSTHTVHAHIKNIYAKLHVKTRSEALREAQRLGVISGW